MKDVDDIVLKRKVMYQFYRKELKKYVQHYIVKQAAAMSINVTDYSIRSMKTKWGSCALISDCLIFNIELAKKPLECIEYIVVHEMVHLHERNHNKNFIMLMNKYLPNWRVQKKVLNELPIV